MAVRRKGFTLIELLVVIGILAVLSTATALIINPVGLFAQGRDSRRMSDLNKINSALDLYQVNLGQPLPQDNTIYVSLPDSSPTCAGHNLPPLNPGWFYACKTSANYKNTNGTGWIPINFSNLSQASFDKIPVDPRNTKPYYYTYVPGRLLTAGIESVKFLRDVAAKDGGTDSTRYEMGDVNIANESVEDPIAYWKFDEGSGTTTSDSSGSNYSGTLISGPTWATGASCKSGACLLFNGTNSYVQVNNFWSSIGDNYKGPITITAWFKANAGTSGSLVDDNNSGEGYIRVRLDTNTVLYNFNGSRTMTLTGPTDLHFAAMTSDSTINSFTSYLDSLSASQVSGACTGFCGPDGYLRIGGGAGTGFFNGYIDEIRVYRRVLSDTEISAIYNE